MSVLVFSLESGCNGTAFLFAPMVRIMTVVEFLSDGFYGPYRYFTAVKCYEEVTFL